MTNRIQNTEVRIQNGSEGRPETLALPSASELRIQQFEQIQMASSYLMKRAKRGSVRAVRMLLNCGKHAFSLLEAEEGTEWLAPGKCADMIGVSVRTIQRAVESGALCVSRTSGGHSRIQKKDFEKWRTVQKPPEND